MGRLELMRWIYCRGIGESASDARHARQRHLRPTLRLGLHTPEDTTLSLVDGSCRAAFPSAVALPTNEWTGEIQYNCFAVERAQI